MLKIFKNFMFVCAPFFFLQSSFATDNFIVHYKNELDQQINSLENGSVKENLKNSTTNLFLSFIDFWERTHFNVLNSINIGKEHKAFQEDINTLVKENKELTLLLNEKDKENEELRILLGEEQEENANLKNVHKEYEALLREFNQYKTNNNNGSGLNFESDINNNINNNNNNSNILFGSMESKGRDIDSKKIFENNKIYNELEDEIDYNNNEEESEYSDHKENNEVKDEIYYNNNEEESEYSDHKENNEVKDEIYYNELENTNDDYYDEGQKLNLRITMGKR